VRLRLVVFLVVVCAVVALLTTWLLELSLERLILLAPVIVVGGAAIAGLALVWARAFAESVRPRRRRA
jgi:hypothetical protein